MRAAKADSSDMVNGLLPLPPGKRRHPSATDQTIALESIAPAIIAGIGASPTFAQILGKQIFVQIFIELIENLRRILLDYGQKRANAANAAFNAAC